MVEFGEEFPQVSELLNKFNISTQSGGRKAKAMIRFVRKDE